MVATALATAAVVIPSLLVRPSQQPGVLLILELVSAGIILGLASQELDVLLVRSLLVALAMPAGWLLGGQTFLCSGLYDCYRGVAIGVVVFGSLGTAALSIFSLPTKFLWDRGRTTPKVRLSVPQPTTPWQWSLLVAAVLMLLAAFYISLGIPAY